LSRFARTAAVVKRWEEERRVRVAATTDPKQVGEVDVALFLVKCYHTESAARLA
jgi:hypothetical protein